MTFSGLLLRSAIIVLPLGLTACGDIDTSSMMSSATPSAAEQTCLARVSNETNNGDVTVLDTSSAESGTFVTVGVGPQRAPWRCALDSSGNVWDVSSMTNEGSL